jgi:hypothetical protein
MFKKLLAVALAAVLAAVVSLPSMAASPPSLDQYTMSFDIDKTNALPVGDTFAVNDATPTAAAGASCVFTYSEKPPTAAAGTMVAAKSKGKKKSKRSVLEVPSQSRSPA